MRLCPEDLSGVLMKFPVPGGLACLSSGRGSEPVPVREWFRSADVPETDLPWSFGGKCMKTAGVAILVVDMLNEFLSEGV